MISPESIDGAFTPVTDPAVASVELDGEAVLYHERLNTVHVLNPTATVIWKCLDGFTNLDGLSTDLAAAFSVDVGMVHTDVLEAVRDFGRQGLLEAVEPDPEALAANVLAEVHPSELPDD